MEDVLLSGHRVPAEAEAAALLVVSELVTNAVRHTRGPCALDVTWAPDGIDIDVTDTSSTPPRLRPLDPSGAEGGYGWRIVRTLASEVAVRPVRGNGKTVHAHVPLSA
ncbi:ATP-binding protein [Streptomyces bambusae]|uniref:ATP-binding protein n=1 Tax=Streptomyces bambusae TaxID=1550616 RepID=UPI0027E20233|nr:ATP-binding protein [Streptomyces bambusae]